MASRPATMPKNPAALNYRGTGVSERVVGPRPCKGGTQPVANGVVYVGLGAVDDRPVGVPVLGVGVAGVQAAVGEEVRADAEQCEREDGALPLRVGVDHAAGSVRLSGGA